MNNYNNFVTKIEKEFASYKNFFLSKSEEVIFTHAYEIAETKAIADFFYIGEKYLIEFLGEDKVGKLYLYQGDVLSGIRNTETDYERAMWLDYDDLAEVVIDFIENFI